MQTEVKYLNAYYIKIVFYFAITVNSFASINGTLRMTDTVEIISVWNVSQNCATFPHHPLEEVDVFMHCLDRQQASKSYLNGPPFLIVMFLTAV